MQVAPVKPVELGDIAASIERNYWERICMEEGITDPVKMQERVDNEKKRIRDFVCGTELRHFKPIFHHSYFSKRRP